LKETEALIERAQKYLRSADILIKEKDYESSVSRTYYAMFYSAEAPLLSKNLSFSSHGGVIPAFGEHFVKKGIFPKSMGREFNRAFTKRQLGDYELTFIFSKEEAEDVLKQGRLFVKGIVEFLKSVDDV